MKGPFTRTRTRTHSLNVLPVPVPVPTRTLQYLRAFLPVPTYPYPFPRDRYIPRVRIAGTDRVPMELERDATLDRTPTLGGHIVNSFF